MSGSVSDCMIESVTKRVSDRMSKGVRKVVGWDLKMIDKVIK